MLNYSDEEKAKIRSYSSHKKIIITFLDDDSFEPIKSNRIYWESLNLTESLCSSANLVFGSCECSEMKIQVADIADDIKNHEIRLDLTVDEIPIPLGIFFIANVEKATDKRYKILTCYDRMYYMQINVSKWYMSVFKTVDTAVTLKELRDSFFEWLGIEQEETSLVNDSIIVRKTLDSDDISGIDVITAICEINGAFGHINRNGIFEYKYLDNSAVYPSEILYPRNDLYPGGGKAEQLTSANYIPPSEQGDYTVRPINKLQIRQEEGDIGAVITSDRYLEEEENGYIIEANFLVYGNEAETLNEIANNLGTKIFGISYTPNSTNLVALPYMEVGDTFYINSLKTPFVSFVLKRTLSGIQAMRDLWVAEGDEFQPETIIGKNKDVIQLRSRVNVLTRTVDETSSEIQRVESDLSGKITETSSKITQTAQGLEAEVKRATEEENKLSTSIQVTADGLSSKVEKDDVISAINQSAESVVINASKIDLKGYVTFSSLENDGYVTNNDLLTSGETTINGANITTGKISAEYIDGTNLKVIGDNAIVQIGASGVENNNYIYMVGYDDYVKVEAHIDSKALSCLGADGFGTSINRAGITFNYNSENYFSILRNHDGRANIGSPANNINILSQIVNANTLSIFGEYAFTTGGKIYKDAGDRIAFGDKNVFIENTLSCQGNVEIGMNKKLVMYGGDIEGAYVSECKVAFVDKNGIPHFDKKLTDIISELYQLV